MKTTVDFPPELMCAIERRAAQEGRELQEVVAEMLAAGLTPAPEANSPPGALVAKQLPRIKARPASPPDARTLIQQEWCDWLKEVEQQHELERYERTFGHQYVDRAGGGDPPPP